MFGEKLRAARKAAKLTQEELAEKIGVKRSVISKYENGIIDPSISQVQNIADALGTNVLKLADFSELSPSLEAAVPYLETFFSIKSPPPGGVTILSDEERTAIKHVADYLKNSANEIENSKMLSDKLQHEYDEIFSTLNIHGKYLAITVVKALASDPKLKAK